MTVLRMLEVEVFSAGYFMPEAYETHKPSVVLKPKAKGYQNESSSWYSKTFPLISDTPGFDSFSVQNISENL